MGGISLKAEEIKKAYHSKTHYTLITRPPQLNDGPGPGKIDVK